jgi:glycosyltransferase involved in cell wall biosynthesis
MKVYFIDSGLGGCYLVRCLLPLQENGWDGDRVSIREGQQTPDNKALAAKQSDIVVFHRPEREEKLHLATILKDMGKKIVFDNDDTLKHDGGFRFNEYMDRERVKKGMTTIDENIDAFLKLANLVTCSTEFLADEYRKINPNVVVLPNCIDPFMFDEPLRNEGEKVRIGVTGSVAITNDLNVLEPILKHYENDPRVQLVVFSLPPNKQDKYMRQLYEKEYEFWDSLQNVEWQPFAPLHEYLGVLNELRLDIMIIPREDNYFNRCKSNIKFLEASMLEIPVIAQGFSDGLSPYQVNPDDQKNMLLATDTQSWIRNIEHLLADKQLRRSMGRQAHEYVEKNYNIADNAHLWVDAYKTLYE